MRRILLACVLAVAGPVSAAEVAMPSGSLPANLPVRRDADAPAEASAWAPSLALALVAGAGGAWAWRRRTIGARGRAQRSDPLVRLGNLALTPHASVHAVQWRGEEWLLACTPQQVTLLSRRAIDPAEQERT